MNLEEIKRIAAARTPGDAYIPTESWTEELTFPFVGDNHVDINDAEFIAMAANNIDKLIAVVEVARNAVNNGGWINNDYIVGLDLDARLKLYKALEALEQE